MCGSRVQRRRAALRRRLVALSAMARNVCAASWVGAAVPVFRRPRVSRRGGVGRLAQPSAAMAGPRVWATTARVPTIDGSVWFKALAPTHRFEAELVPLLAAGWPDLLPHVVAADSDRGWLLLADAGTSFDE